MTKFTSKKAQYYNFAQDGIKLRSQVFRNKKKYNRNNKTWKNES